nr:hypothetical protein [Tanacetum cinerariifolium]
EEGADITVNALHPGVITTNLARHSNFLTSCLYGGIIKHFQKNIPQGASTTCFLALNPKAKEFSGDYFVDNNVATVSGYAKDPELAKKLWECGMELTASKNPLTYDFEILSKAKNVDLSSMDYDALGRLTGIEFSGENVVKMILLCVFELNEADGSDNDLEDDLFDYFSEDDSDTGSVDHLSDGEEEVFEVRTQKTAPKPRHKSSKMFDVTFLTRIYSALDREEYVDTDVRPLAEDHDIDKYRVDGGELV